ncbi:MAG TPA: type IX secretion system protein PorQ [Bacteroidales bacterium]|nr:type IX secretion system protein PorQ [Bacteroidales bacterium]HSA42547.1 type IX secretion system protein PorQ [Bacteroidales bacterium]
MLNKNHLLFFLIVCMMSQPAVIRAQSGPGGTYQFLNLTTSARIAALGGANIPLTDQDVSLAWANPSLISPKMDKALAMSFLDFYSDINCGSVAFSGTLEDLGSYASSIHFVNYGKFIQTDAGGNILGEFTASEYAFQLGWGRSLDSNFSLGAALKLVYSDLFNDISYGLGVDVAGTYRSDDKSFHASLVLRNYGRQLKAYRSGEREAFPFSAFAGISKKLKHVPFRYTIIYDRIDKFDLSYDDPLEDKVDPLTNQPVEKDKVGDFFDNLGRHIIIGGEFIPSENLSVRVGYNYGRRKELGVVTRMSTVGFSWGIGVRIKKIEFNYSRSTYHLSGSPNYLTITTRLSDLFPE